MNKKIAWGGWIGLAALAFTATMGKPGLSTVQAIDTALHAKLSIDLLHGGQLSLPMGAAKHGGHMGEGFNDHPLPMFLLTGGLIRWLGADGWTVRAPSAFFSAGCILLVAALGAWAWGQPLGLFAGFILAFTVEFFRHGAWFQLDTPMLFFILLSFLLWLHGKPIGSGICAGLAVLMKTPVGLLIFPSALLTQGFLLNRQGWKTTILWKNLGKALGATALTLAAYWVTFALAGYPELVKDYWMRQVFGTLVHARGQEGASSDFLALPTTLLKRYWPWLPFAAWGVWQVLSKRPSGRSKTLLTLSLCAASVVYLIISSMRFRSGIHYFLPLYPFLALLAAYGAANIPKISDWVNQSDKWIAPVACLVVGVILCTPIRLSPEAFPGLRRFVPFIASYGQCSDIVAFVEGGQPYGGRFDYLNLISFYTGRRAIGSHCEKIAQDIQSPEVGWVIGVEEHAQCAPLQREFPFILRFGNQVLWSRRIPQAFPVDMSPLHRELKAAVDCVPPEYEPGKHPTVFIKGKS